MLVVYKNRHDDYKLYIGTIITKPDNAIIYVDIDTYGNGYGGCIKTGKPDWKNSHINSVMVEDCVGVFSTHQDIKNYFPEEFIR